MLIFYVIFFFRDFFENFTQVAEIIEKIKRVVSGPDRGNCIIVRFKENKFHEERFFLSLLGSRKKGMQSVFGFKVPVSFDK